MKKTLLALTAAGALALGFSTAAKADPTISIGFGFGGFAPYHHHHGWDRGPWGRPGFYGAGYYGGYDYAPPAPDCGYVTTTGWYRLHGRPVFGPHRTWVCE